MSFETILSIVIVGVLAIGVLYLLLVKNKSILDAMSKFQNQLTQSGIESSSIIDKNHYLEKIGQTAKKTDDRIEGILEIARKEFDYIFLWMNPHRSGSENRWQYTVTGGNSNDMENTPKRWLDTVFYQRVTELSIKKDRLLLGKATGVSWKGDSSLAPILNADSLLNEKITQLIRTNKQPKEIFIFWKGKFAGIRTPLYTPKAEDFEVMNTIAKHVKSAWFSS